MNQDTTQLSEMVNNAKDVLASATTVFPFTLFPDTLSIDREKLTIVHRTFFKVSEVMSIHTEDILNVTANAGPFFGSLALSTRFFHTDKPYRINYFWRDDALRLKSIIQGFIIAKQSDVDMNNINSKELTNMLISLGSGTTDEESTAALRQ
jgi:hypothetical protein